MGTLSARLKSKTNSVWRRRINGNEKSVRANGSDLFLGAGVTGFGETAPDVDLCGEDEQLSGIIVGNAEGATNLNNDADNPFDDNVNLKMGIPTVSEEVYLTSKAGSTVTKGKIVQCDGGFFEDSDFNVNESAANVPYAGSLMLQALESVTGVSGIEYIFLAKRV